MLVRGRMPSTCSTVHVYRIFLTAFLRSQPENAPPPAARLSVARQQSAPDAHCGNAAWDMTSECDQSSLLPSLNSPSDPPTCRFESRRPLRQRLSTFRFLIQEETWFWSYWALQFATLPPFPSASPTRILSYDSSLLPVCRQADPLTGRGEPDREEAFKHTHTHTRIL